MGPTSARDLFRDIWAKADHSTKLASHRICTPDETFARIEPLLAAAGITRIADVTGLDSLRIPVAVVTRPNSRGLSASQGKGLDFLAAKVSGAMEALETYHAERIDRPVYLLRWSELARTDRAVDPDRLPRLRNSLFHAEKRIPWITAFDLVSGRERLVPLELVHTDFTLPALPGTGCFPRSSNGLASGNSFGEAAVHGLCELVERDAYALYESNPDRGSRVDLATVSDPVPRSLIELIQKAGGRLTIRDITSDIGIPVLWATITGGGNGVTAAPAGGLGCHPDRVWACVRAITEAAQSRATRLSGSRDDLTPGWFQNGRTQTPPSAQNGTIALDVETSFCGKTIGDDLRWLVGRLIAHGFSSILAVDLSRPDFGLPVLRLLVPGLEHPGEDVSPGFRTSGDDI
jgi:ribosomal protein S12 methylthiotransferase accessory factor